MPPPALERRGDHDQVGERDAEAAERHLDDGRRLAAARRLPLPQRQDERREGEDHERVERLEPGDGDLPGPEQQVDGAVGVAVGPERDGVALLLVGGPEERHRQREQHERAHGAPFVAAERLCLALRQHAASHVRRQRARGVEIDRQPERHADAGRAEAVVPAELLAERAADQRRQERAEVDADIEDREGAVAARIAGRIERADLGRDVGLERAVAEDEDEQREQKQRLERHHEMTDGHQRLRRSPPCDAGRARGRRDSRRAPG